LLSYKGEGSANKRKKSILIKFLFQKLKNHDYSAKLMLDESTWKSKLLEKSESEEK
jgi:hypothetical protein